MSPLTLCNIVTNNCWLFNRVEETQKHNLFQILKFLLFLFQPVSEAVEMDNGYNVWGRFFVLIRTSAYVFEWFNCFPSILILISLYFQPPKIKQIKKTQLLLLGFIEHRTLTSALHQKHHSSQPLLPFRWLMEFSDCCH